MQEYQQHSRELLHVPVFGIDLENEKAFLIFSIIATVLTVCDDQSMFISTIIIIVVIYSFYNYIRAQVEQMSRNISDLTGC